MDSNLNRWARSASALVAILGLASIATADKAAVKFNVPEGWTTKAVPTEAEQVDVKGTELELEQNSAYRQTLSERAANVAEVIANSGSACAIYGVRNGAKQRGSDTFDRDVWLKVSGGTYSQVVGASWNYWKTNGQSYLQGDVFVEITGSETSITGDVIGANEKSAKDETQVKGNVMVVISGGASVSGSILGGGTSYDGASKAKNEGNTTVRILSLLPAGTSGSHILGGSKFVYNNGTSHSCLLHTGNTAVEVALKEGTEGTFGKTIIGGSYADGVNDSKATNYSITGSTSTSITAPNSVTFSSPIYGSSVSAKKLADASVSGTSSTTINGGTYSSGIYAAGSGAKAVVKGKATLTLKAGVFNGATLGVGASGATAGSSELVIAGAIDLSSATVNDDFGALTLQGDLTLGTNRLPSATLSIDGDTTRTITLTLTDAEYALFSAELCAFSDTEVPENLAVEATYPGGTEAVTGWSLKVANGKLIYSCDSSVRTWETPEEGTAWADGLSGFVEGDNVIFGSNKAQESVTLPTSGVRVKDLTVQGSYAFEGTGGVLSAVDVSIEENGSLALNTPVNALRLTTSNPANDAIAELILTRGGKAVAWPRGTTIIQKNTDASIADVSPNWSAGGNQTVNALIDGVYGLTEGTGTYTNPADGSKGTYTAAGKNNKWWPTKAGSYVVITLGSPTLFDGYVLWTADTASRNPTGWTLEGSTDGGATWITLDTRSSVASPGTLVAYAYGEPFETTPIPTLAVATTLSVAGELSGSAAITAASATFASGSVLSGAPTLTADAISFEAGSTIKVDASGVATLVGTVSGSATIVLAEGFAEPALLNPFPVLKAPEGLKLTPPEGYALAAYTEGYYRMYRMAPIWTPGESDNTWSNPERWSGLSEEGVVPTSGAVEVNFGSGTTPTLTIDAEVALETLFVRGSVAGTIEVGEGASLAVNTLLAETDLTFPAGSLPADTALLSGKTLTLTGDGELATAFSTASKLVLAEGTVKLVDGVDLASLTGITIESGATLDFNGKTFQSTPITLAGGTIANSSETNALTGAVTLTADSFVEATTGEVHFNAVNNARNDLVLNNHKLTKTGSKLFKVCGVDVDKGTIRVQEGALQLDNAGADSTMSNTTLSFAKGSSYTAKGWVRTKSGTITLDADEGADIVFYNSDQQAHLKGDCNLVKTGLGKITVPFRNDSLWSGTLTVNGGTLDLYKTTTTDTTFSKSIAVADGATLQKSGSTGKVTLSGALSGYGTIEVQTGSVVPTAANGNFKGNWKVASGATLSSTSSVYWQFGSAGAIEVNGTLKFDGSPTVIGQCVCNSAISGTGTIYINQGLALWNTITCTGKIVLKAGKTLTDTDKTGVVGSYSISGSDLECNGTIKGTGGSITLPEGKTLSGTGTIESAVALSEGAVLGGSSATASSRLTLSGALTAEGNVSVVLPSSLTSGLQLVKWTSAPAGATYTASTTLPALAFLHAKTDGLYYDVMSIVDGGTAGSGGSIENLSDAAKHALAEAAFDKGATSIKSVTGTQGGEKLSATAIDGALSCFALTPTVNVTDGVATITIAYDFGISGMSAVMVDGAPVATVKAKVENGSVAASLADGAEIILQSKDKNAGETAWEQVKGATFEKNGDIYEATVSLSDVSNKVFRVLARTTK